MAIFNMMSSVLAVLSIISGMRKLNISFYAVFFLVVCGIDWLGSSTLYALPLRIIVGAIIVGLYTRKAIDSIFFIFTAESVISYFIFLTGPAFHINQHWLNEHVTLFNFIMCIFVVLIGICFRKIFCKSSKYLKMLTNKVKLIFVAFEAVTIIPISVWYRALTQKHLFLVTSIILLNLTIMLLFMCWLFNLLIKQKEVEIEANKDMQRTLILWDLGKNIHLTGSTIPLLREYINANDIDSIRMLYEKHIGPVHKKHCIDDEISKLESIHMQLLYNFLYELIIRKDNIELYIDGVIDIKSLPEVDLFIILAQYIQNALEHMKGHNDGVIRIYMFQNKAGEAFIEISNTFYGEKFNLFDIVNAPCSKGRMGFGLRYIREMLEEKQIIYRTYIEGKKFVQSLEFEG